MRLYILRHATAEEAASSGDDGARKLTERSKEKMRGAAAGLRAMGLKFNVILTSPLARAAETAEIVSAAYENNPPPQVLPALATGVAATDAVAALRAFSKHEDVMIVGHEPQLSAVASILLTGASDVVHVKLKTGGCIAIDLPARFERSDAMHDTLEEIRRAGKLALKPVNSSAPITEKIQNNESDPTNQSRVAQPDHEDPPHSNHNSMNAHSATESIS